MSIGSITNYLSPAACFTSLKNTVLPVLTSLKEHVIFFGLFCKNHKTVGSVAPSSKALARTITNYILPKENNDLLPQNYLEIGPGTGPFTKIMAERLRDIDTLHIVEIMPEFAKMLTKKYGGKKNIKVHCCSILEWKNDKQFDRVVSGLPLNSFSPEFVAAYLEKVKSLTSPDGIIADFRYPKLPSKKIKLLACTDRFCKRNDRQKFEKVLSATDKFFKDFGFAKTLVKQKSGDAEVRYFRMPNIPAEYKFNITAKEINSGMSTHENTSSSAPTVSPIPIPA